MDTSVEAEIERRRSRYNSLINEIWGYTKGLSHSFLRQFPTHEIEEYVNALRKVRE